MSHEVVRADDPRAAALLAAGWRVIGESWGARLRLGEPPDLAPFVLLVGRAGRTAQIRELDAGAAAAIAALEADTHDDFPHTPATAHRLRDAAATAALLASGFRAFGAVAEDGRLLAVTIVRAEGGAAETEVTAVARDARRRGLAAGVKAASVMALAAEGVRTFGTGGAAVNAGSLAMNRALGYTLEERWLSLSPPAAAGTSPAS